MPSRQRPSEWRLVTNHARALLVIAQQPDLRLRDLAGGLDVTERTASGILTDLTNSGYLAKQRQTGVQQDARRNHYEIVHDLALNDPALRHRTIGEFLAFIDDGTSSVRSKRARDR